MKINYNDKYQFISNGDYFKENTACIVQSLWDSNILRNDSHAWDLKDLQCQEQMTLQFMEQHKDHIHGIFRGTWTVQTPQNYQSLYTAGLVDKNNQFHNKSDLCRLNEFRIVRKEPDEK